MRLSELLQYCTEEELIEWESLSLGYSMQSGDPRLRRIVAATSFESIGEDQITIVAPQEGIYLAMLALLSSTDAIVATTPCYQSLYSVAWSIGCQVHNWPARKNHEAKTWEFRVEELEALLNQKANIKVVVMQFPNNPTGALPSEEEVRHVVELCRKKGVWIFNDEMYRGLEHGTTRKPLPAMPDMYPEKGVSLGGLSKSFGLPGLRVGWLAAKDEAFTSRVRELKDYTTICTASPSEFLGRIALSNATSIQAEKKGVVKRGLKQLTDFINAHPDALQWLPPRGGTFSIVTLTGLSKDSANEYYDNLILSHSLMLLPCDTFGLENTMARVCYGTEGVADRLEAWRRASPQIFSA